MGRVLENVVTSFAAHRRGMVVVFSGTHAESMDLLKAWKQRRDARPARRIHE